MSKIVPFAVLGVAIALVAFASRTILGKQVSVPISTGKLIQPAGEHTEVGSFPVNVVRSPNGKFLVVSDSGAREQLSVLSTADGHLLSKLDFNATPKGGTKEQLYFGMCFLPDGTLLVSRGGEDKISQLQISESGVVSNLQKDLLDTSADPAMPNYPAGIACSSDGKSAYVVNNETYYLRQGTGFKQKLGSLSVIDIAANKVLKTIDVGGFPFAVAAITTGPDTDRKAYVTCERDGYVAVVDLNSGIVTKKLNTGAQPVNLTLSRDQKTLFCSNAGSDTIAFIDTATDSVKKSVLVREWNNAAFGGITPLGTVQSNDGKTLFAALADINAVAVIDVPSAKLMGYIPVGWYPTAVGVSPDDKSLFVANAKGVQVRNPNGKAVAGRGKYIENLLEGTISTIALDPTLKELPLQTKTVVSNNRLGEKFPFLNPKPKHVIYIIKENRTYDQVLGDLEGGNGDPSLCMFGKDITPNQHALAKRFLLLDNFYVCSEVSADGWNWSTAAIASAYTQRNTRVNYSDRGRDFDFQGVVNGLPSTEGVPDVAEPPTGYLWDAALRAKVSLRNYGWFVEHTGRNEKFPIDTMPVKTALRNITDTNFLEFDMTYNDSDAWVKIGKHAPKQMLKFGRHDAPSRFSEWKREFDEYVKNGNLPALTVMQFPHNHTQGTAAGFSSPRAMVADNDYAVGELVDTVSHSRYWKDTVICILEDDSQAGTDHVDCHRSPALIISPYIKPNTVVHRFYNTVSMIRTIEMLLGIKPMNQYDAFAPPIDVFTTERANLDSYTAVMASESILAEVNTPVSYRAKDSERILDRFSEETESDLELNDILIGEARRVGDLR